MIHIITKTFKQIDDFLIRLVERKSMATAYNNNNKLSLVTDKFGISYINPFFPLRLVVVRSMIYNKITF